MRFFSAVVCFVFLGMSATFSQNSYRNHFTQGNLLVEEKNYSIALDEFLKAYTIDSSNANINYKVGICYLKAISKRNRATRFLEKAVLNASKKYMDFEASEKSAPIEAYFAMGQAYHLESRFDEAITNFERYKSLLSKYQVKEAKETDREIEWSKNAKEFMANPAKVIIKNLGDSINSIYPDYGPVISADENTLIFTSRRPGSGDNFNAIGDDGQYYEDIYIAYKKPNGEWGQPKLIGTNINTSSNESSISLSADAQQLLIYKDENGGDIYYSNLNIETWTIPQKMGDGSPYTDINTSAWEPSACLSRDGNTLYFVSDRKGGFGGRDIWRCVKLPNGKWSKATNLGQPVNTEYDEDAPFIHPDEITLYFSSNGHKTMGGFDVFTSQYSEDKGWSEPVNIGYPINTTDDDIFYVTSPDGRRGYFSSDREGGLGDKDIYVVSSEGDVQRDLTLIKGVISPETGKPLPDDLEIVVTNRETMQPEGSYKPLRRNGSFAIIIPPNSKYKFSYQANGAEFYSEDIDVPSGSGYKEILKELSLNPIRIGGKDKPAESKAAVDEGPVALNMVSVSGKLTDKGKPVKGAKISVFDNSTGLLVSTITSDDNGGYTFRAKRGSSLYVSVNNNGVVNSGDIMVDAKKGKETFDKNISLSELSNGKSSKTNTRTMVLTKQKWEPNRTYFQIEIDAPVITQSVIDDGAVLCYYSFNDNTTWSALPMTNPPTAINVSYSVNDLKLTALQFAAAPDPVNIKIIVVNSPLPKWLDVTDYEQVKAHLKLKD